MEKPKCPACKERHYGPCNTFEVVTNDTPPVEMVVNKVANTVVNRESVVANESRHGKYRDQEARRRYMREYMRQIRSRGAK